MKHNYSIHAFVLAGLLAFVPTSYAQSDGFLKTSRYSFLNLSPQPDETDMLSVVVEIEFPREIQKVGDALVYLLKNSGFRLEDPERSGRHQYVLYNFDLPEVHRKIGPVTLWDALSVIANDGFFLWTNPLLRTLRFEVDAIYPFEISEPEIACARDGWLNRHDPDYIPCINPAEDETDNPGSELLIYGPVRYGDTLYRIAEFLRFEGVATEQVMAAIFHANPEAFGGNVNLLLAGVVLEIPDIETIKGVNLEEAKALIHTHHRQWQGKRGGKKNG